MSNRRSGGVWNARKNDDPEADRRYNEHYNKIFGDETTKEKLEKDEGFEDKGNGKWTKKY